MIIHGEKGNNGQGSGTRGKIAGKVPLPDEAKDIDMKKAAVYLARLNARILIPCKNELVPLLEKVKIEAREAANGNGNSKHIAMLKSELAAIDGWLKDTVAEEKDMLGQGDLTSERQALSYFGHHAGSMLTPLLSNLSTLLMKMEAKSEKTPVAANLVVANTSLVNDMLSVLGGIGADDVGSVSLLFCVTQSSDLVSAMKAAKE